MFSCVDIKEARYFPFVSGASNLSEAPSQNIYRPKLKNLSKLIKFNSGDSADKKMLSWWNQAELIKFKRDACVAIYCVASWGWSILCIFWILWFLLSRRYVHRKMMQRCILFLSFASCEFSKIFCQNLKVLDYHWC